MIIKNPIYLFIFCLSLLSFPLFVSANSDGQSDVPKTVNINFLFDSVTENVAAKVKVDLNLNSRNITLINNRPVTLNGQFLELNLKDLNPEDFLGLNDVAPELKVTLTDSNNNELVAELIPLYSVPYTFVSSYTENIPPTVNVKSIKAIGEDDDGVINIEAHRVVFNSEVQFLSDDAADLAENFYFSDASDITPGTVVAIDTSAQPGILKQSTMAYDSRVIGVVSGANGLSPGAIIGDGDHPVALAGRVWVYSDASYEAIQPGDWLASSNTPGYAMKASSVTRGGIIGKAMTALPRGQKGFVLMMVSLQ